ncbi:hypothetical protein Daus18300_009870 [Diaporthe australafricana]|uniref:NWD NACHT-NTPase N-terminal domain-containing protein n=1 Tax=Diaporthe australafricana TaxID=127596 RepID=A0ABR3WD19_9PEZI
MSRVRDTLRKLKAKAFLALRPSGGKALSGDPEPAVAEGSGAAGGEVDHDSAVQEPVATSPDAQTRATEDSVAQNLAAQDPVPTGPAAQVPIRTAQSAPESVVPQPWDVSIRRLWDIAYEDLRHDNPELIDKYEALIRNDMSAAFSTILPVGPLKREQMQSVLQRKIDDVKRGAWKLKFGSWTEIELKNTVQPVLGVIKLANNYITDALSGSSQASIAWAGISLFLPVGATKCLFLSLQNTNTDAIQLLLNPAQQASSLAGALEYVSNLILQWRMREDLFIRSCESGTGAAGPQGLSPKIYKVQFCNPI